MFPWSTQMRAMPTKLQGATEGHPASHDFPCPVAPKLAHASAPFDVPEIRLPPSSFADLSASDEADLFGMFASAEATTAEGPVLLGAPQLILGLPAFEQAKTECICANRRGRPVGAFPGVSGP
eukprot:TRINITY_DN32469_c0_g1_i1.p2 TRINITY_DN32469_c0_g1~~TRINITY_DN32469_c0_g1_i1.p2  ORF type:complete len:123 (-),score=18.62 TRINITY_DN32469_c0_g1_i1:423-791(-)